MCIRDSTYTARLFYGAVLLLTLPAFFTVQYYYLHCPPFLRCSSITYTARLFYGAVLLLTLHAFFYGTVLLLTLPAFFTVQFYHLHWPSSFFRSPSDRSETNRFRWKSTFSIRERQENFSLSVPLTMKETLCLWLSWWRKVCELC